MIANARRPLFTQAAHRVAKRFEPQVARAFLSAIAQLVGRIKDVELANAIASDSLSEIEAVIGADRLEMIFLNDPALREALRRTSVASGIANAEILSDATGFTLRFNQANANVVVFAREQAAQLVVAVSEDVREAIRIFVSIAAQRGITVEQQARLIREVVGLPPNWVEAPVHLADELREGRFTQTRRLSAVDKAQIRSRIAKGTVDEAFIARMQTKYAQSLLNRRALNIARTETVRAAHRGQQESWRQAIVNKVLPDTVRQVWIVTNDDRLRETHRAVPGLNPNGVLMGQPFQTPLGPVFAPPLEPLCRCGIALRI